MTDQGAEPQSLALIDEEGKERRFALHDAFDVDDVTYYLVEALDDPSVVLVLRDADGGLETVEGDELERVIAAAEVDADE